MCVRIICVCEFVLALMHALTYSHSHSRTHTLKITRCIELMHSLAHLLQTYSPTLGIFPFTCFCFDVVTGCIFLSWRARARGFVVVLVFARAFLLTVLVFVTWLLCL